MNKLTRALMVTLTAAPFVLVTVACTPAVQAAAGGPDQAPVMGWSSWSFLRLGANTQRVEGEARALVQTGLAKAGYRYVNVDDGWYQCPGPQGPTSTPTGAGS